MQNYYITSTEHLFAEVNRIEQKLLAYYELQQPQEHEDLKELLKQQTQIELQSECEDIEQKVQNALKENIPLRLVALKQAFGLCDLEKDILLLCLLSHIDEKYEYIFAALRGSKVKIYPGKNLILKIVCDSAEERQAGQRYFTKTAPLFRHNLLTYAENEKYLELASATRQIKVDTRVADYLLDSTEIDMTIDSFAELYMPSELSEQTDDLSESGKQIAERILSQKNELQANNGNYLFHFQGKNETGRKETALHVCGELNIPLIVIDVQRAFFNEGTTATLKILPFIPRF